MSTSDSANRAEDTARALLSQRIRRVAAVDPEATAFTFGDATYTWQHVRQAIDDLDAMLAPYPQARRVGIVLRNRPGPLCAVLATIAGGRALITLSPHLGDAGLAEDVIDLAPDVIVAEDDDWSRDSLRDAAEQVGAIVVRSGADRALTPLPAEGTPEPAARPAGDLAVLMMTSGTTGRPKRVALSYLQMVAAFRAAGTQVDDASEPRLHSRTAILWASLAHISGLYFVIAHAVEGRTVALLERFDVQGWAEVVRRHRPAHVRLAPTALRMVLDADLPSSTFESIRAVGSGSAPLSPELAEAFEERYGIPVLSTYGATEFAGAVAGWSLRDKQKWGSQKRGSVGRAHPGIELQVVDRDEGHTLAAGEIGVLCARGGQVPTRDGEWLRTTDLASLDQDGFLYIHGRLDDAINRGGFKIPPTVIEEALEQHPAVLEASAVGLPDDRLGEVPVVAVTLSGPAEEDELMDFLSRRLTRYQRPVALRIVGDLPRTPSLKVSRGRVRELFVAGADKT
ncbi:acyl--CoA ligase [Nocardioides sp. cx-169]|uniref:class I adenylate-forming enzyme family protein n=1 Tax=Nocardioides sp. cx-169 TaxID=2899080 RepID=UPI001E4034EB|nr:class I adenylate-forming enzyme family protein [Nocardioides sp. cx-169]MCD4533031.1 acyl--CoA ligase [Nocardioides sp. cx-169]